jgi:hypothetical protein
MAIAWELQKSEMEKYMADFQRKQKEELAKWLESEKSKMATEAPDQHPDSESVAKMSMLRDVKTSLCDVESRDSSTRCVCYLTFYTSLTLQQNRRDCLSLTNF